MPQLSQAVPAAMSQVDRRHMRTRLKKPSSTTPTCTVVNFHNLHSLLGLFGSLVFEQTESSDWCWFVVKK